MLYIDTELYIDGSARDAGGVGETETLDDRTIEVELRNADLGRKQQSLNRPRRIRKIGLPDIKSATRDAFKQLLTTPVNTRELQKALESQDTTAVHETITLPEQQAKQSPFASKPRLPAELRRGSVPTSRHDLGPPISPFVQSQMTVLSGTGKLNPLIQKVKDAHDSRRHQSVAPKHVLAAEGRSLYYSPSHIKLGVVDRIFHENGSLAAQSRGNSKLAQRDQPSTTRFGGKGYPNIFSARTLNPNELVESRKQHAGTSLAGGSGLDSVSLAGPQETYMRQEIFLQKITSEKRNMLAHKRFANSGFGQQHGHKYFVRKID